jgi:glycosyltransferase involved in cell wall biosynthesis
MSNLPLISICIPAYKRIEFLKRLFDSIAIQTYKDYEVIITDDSPDEVVSTFVKNYVDIKNVFYFRNLTTLGTPENWNESIRKARGTWIKLMHDDDWFTNENSLQGFYEATVNHQDYSFIFSGHNNIIEGKSAGKKILLNATGNLLLKWSPLNLFKKQYVGNPSCTLIRRDIDVFYDSNFKWVVDFEFYIRCLLKVKKYCYINLPLINVGINDAQVTNYTFRQPQIEIPENHIMAEKLGVHILRNIFVYDYYWRMYRNLGIRNIQDIKQYFTGSVHPLLAQMVNAQNKIPVTILKKGFFSKLFMLLTYLRSLFTKT